MIKWAEGLKIGFVFNSKKLVPESRNNFCVGSYGVGKLAPMDCFRKTPETFIQWCSHSIWGVKLFQNKNLWQW